MEACIYNLRTLEVGCMVGELQRDDRCKKAVESFVSDQEARGRFPLQVSLGQLVAFGYLSNEDVKQYEKGHVILVLAEDQKRPCIAGVRVRFCDGLEFEDYHYAGLRWSKHTYSNRWSSR